MSQQSVLVKDTNGNLNKWNIYEETEFTYKICADCDKRFITEIYKSDTDYINGAFYAREIINPFSKMKRYCKAEFCEILLKDYEC